MRGGGNAAVCDNAVGRVRLWIDLLLVNADAGPLSDEHCRAALALLKR